MAYIDIGKSYREKVNNFNAGSYYGAEMAKIQQQQQDRTDGRVLSGLNKEAHDSSYWEKENPHSSVLGDQALLNGTFLWNTKFQEKEVNTIQYKQPPSYGYNANRWIGHLLEIEANRVPNVKPSFAGDGNSVLIVDKNG